MWLQSNLIKVFIETEVLSIIKQCNGLKTSGDLKTIIILVLIKNLLEN